jgi:hypothetical protein
MLEPVKFLYKLFDRIENTRIARKRKDFLLTAIVLAIVGYVLTFPLIALAASVIAEIVKKALGF